MEFVPDDIDEYFTKDEMVKLSEYEKSRYRNIRRNYEMMIAVGLPASKPEFMKGPRSRARQKSASKRKACESESSDEEWTPYRNAGQNKRSKRKITFNVPAKKKDEDKLDNQETVTASSKKNRRRSNIKEREESPSAFSHKYPLRQLPQLNYMDLEAPEDDDFIFCEDCDKEHCGDCPIHGPYEIISDSKVTGDWNPDRPYQTLPDGLAIKNSGIKGAGLGVWAEKNFQPRIRFGPYEGDITLDTDEAHSTGYSWQIYQEGRPKHFVNAFRMETSNWMRFVNCARSENEQNLVAYQYHGQIYYRTYKVVQPGTELLVWYGHDYGKELGIVRKKIDIIPKIINGEEIYRCQWCPVSLSTLKYLSKHCKYKHGQCVGVDRNKKYEGNDIYRCTMCDVCYSYIDYLVKHMETAHKQLITPSYLPNKKMIYSAEYRLKEMKSQVNESQGLFGTYRKAERPQNMNHDKENVCLIQHKKPCDNDTLKCRNDTKTCKRMHIGDKTYKCDVCGYSANQISHLKGHQRIHTGDKPYKCDVCGYSANQISNLKTHQRIHTGDKPYKCDVCGYSANQISHLKGHQRIHTGDKPYKCDVCGYSAVHIGNLKGHQRIHTGDKPYKCDVCGYSANQMGALKTHQRIHTGDKPYKCDVCGYSANRMDTLKTHQRIHTGDKPYKCDVCGYSANRMDTLKTHQRIHTGDKPYKCDVCGYSANQMGALKTHQRIHTGDKPYKCDVCGYSANQISHLKTHQRIHTGDKPYKCDVCGYSANRIGDLKTHQRIHTGDKPYKCDVCGYSAVHIGNLKRHQRIHTGDKPYKCDVCGYSTSHLSSLKTHTKTHLYCSNVGNLVSSNI